MVRPFEVIHKLPWHYVPRSLKVHATSSSGIMQGFHHGLCNFEFIGIFWPLWQRHRTHKPPNWVTFVNESPVSADKPLIFTYKMAKKKQKNGSVPETQKWKHLVHLCQFSDGHRLPCWALAITEFGQHAPPSSFWTTAFLMKGYSRESFYTSDALRRDRS